MTFAGEGASATIQTGSKLPTPPHSQSRSAWSLEFDASLEL